MQRPKRSKKPTPKVKPPQQWTEDYLKSLVAAGNIRGYQVIGSGRPDLQAIKKRGNPGNQKHSNQVCEYDGLRFDSLKERKRYIALAFLQQQGIITNLRTQVPYDLNEGGEFLYRYIADFVYIDAATGAEIVEDAKGFRTREYKKKKKLMLRIHGIMIKET